MTIKNNDELCKKVSDLEDKYSYVDDKGGLHRSSVNIPDDDPELKEIHEYIKNCGKDDVEHQKHYEAFNYHNELLAKGKNRKELIDKLRAMESLKKGAITQEKLRIALEKNEGKFNWGYVILRNENNV